MPQDLSPRCPGRLIVQRDFFQNSGTGIEPTAWPAASVGGGNNNTSSSATTMDVNGNRLRQHNSASGDTGWVFSTQIRHSNVGLLIAFEFDSIVAGTVQVALRAQAATSATGAPSFGWPALAYGWSLDPSTGNMTLYKTNAFTSLGTFSGSALSANTKYWVRFEAVGGTIRARMWADGVAEPSTWQVTGTDTTITVGDYFQLSSSGGAVMNYYFHQFAAYEPQKNPSGFQRLMLLLDQVVALVRRPQVIMT